MKIFGIIHTLDQFPPIVKHAMDEGKSYLFLGDSWKEIGDIDFNYTQFGDVTCVEVQYPNISEFVEKHDDEGANDWATWGPRVN